MKKTLICVPMSEKLPKSFERIRDLPFLYENSELHLLHVFENRVYVNEFSPYSFPSGDQTESIRESVLGYLDQTVKTIFPGKKPDKIFTHCLFDFSPKSRTIDFIKENNINLVITATRESYGPLPIFSGSFSDYLLKHSSSDLYVLRPQ